MIDVRSNDSQNHDGYHSGPVQILITILKSNALLAMLASRQTWLAVLKGDAPTLTRKNRGCRKGEGEESG